MKPRHRPLALLAALAAASAPAHAATVGPIENLPAAQALGREAFPVDPIGRTWTYRRPDGTTVERQVRPFVGVVDGLNRGEQCRIRGLVTTRSNGASGSEELVWLDACDDQVGQIGSGARMEELRTTLLRFPLTSIGTPERHRARAAREDVVGKALVDVLAGRFPVTAMVESASPPRRVFYAANVGPVLEQVKDAAGNWVTDLVLESYEVKPTTVVVESDREGSAGETERALVPAPAGATAPSRAELGPLESLPDGANIGAEIFPLGPDGRRWTFRVVRDQSVIERELWSRVLVRIGVHRQPPCPDFEWKADATVLNGASRASPHFYACPEGLRWKNDFGLEAAPRLWMPLPLQQGSSWATDGPDLEPPAVTIHEIASSRRVLGRSLVVTPAGRFEKAVLIETFEPARSVEPERAVRRTYYAANVGPVLVLVPEGDRWVADLVLESIVVPPPAAPRGTAAPPAVEAGRSLGRPVVP